MVNEWVILIIPMVLKVRNDHGAFHKFNALLN